MERLIKVSDLIKKLKDDQVIITKGMGAREKRSNDELNKYGDSLIKWANEAKASIERESKPQICYKTNEPCKYNCKGLCKESY